MCSERGRAHTQTNPNRNSRKKASELRVIIAALCIVYTVCTEHTLCTSCACVYKFIEKAPSWLLNFLPAFSLVHIVGVVCC